MFLDSCDVLVNPEQHNRAEVGMKGYIALKIALALLLLSLFGWTAAAQDVRAALIEWIRPAVVAVTIYNDDDEVVDQISGFFISKDGDLLSCRHVFRGASRVEVQTREGKVYAVRLVIAEDPDLDLVQLLVDVPEGEVPYLRMIDVNATNGEQVTAVGHQHIVQGFVLCSNSLRVWEDLSVFGCYRSASDRRPCDQQERRSDCNSHRAGRRRSVGDSGDSLEQRTCPVSR